MSTVTPPSRGIPPTVGSPHDSSLTEKLNRRLWQEAHRLHQHLEARYHELQTLAQSLTTHTLGPTERAALVLSLKNTQQAAEDLARWRKSLPPR